MGSISGIALEDLLLSIVKKKFASIFLVLAALFNTTQFLLIGTSIFNILENSGLNFLCKSMDCRTMSMFTSQCPVPDVSDD
jgi:hypothetical protein